MHFTRARDLVVAGCIGLAFGYLLFRFAYGSLPSLPPAAGSTLGVLGLIELILGFLFRNRIREGQVLSAIAVARAVALAKASSVLGALMLGGWLGALGHLLPNTDQLVAAATDTTGAIIGAGCAAVLIGCALWLEHCCRTPDSRDEDRDQPPTS